MDTIQELFRYIPAFERRETDSLNNFIDDFYKVVEEESLGYDLYHYQAILEKNDLEWSMDSLTSADVTDKDVECLLAMILSIIRADRFSDGTLREIVQEGYYATWLSELRVIKH